MHISMLQFSVWHPIAHAVPKRSFNDVARLPTGTKGLVGEGVVTGWYDVDVFVEQYWNK